MRLIPTTGFGESVRDRAIPDIARITAVQFQQIMASDFVPDSYFLSQKIFFRVQFHLPI